MAWLAVLGVLWDRVLPGGENTSGGGTNPLNLMLIVGGALLISVLARYLSRRGGQGGKK